MKSFWTELDKRARIVLVGSVLVVALALIAAGAWLLRTDQQVLFSDLKPQDSAAMVAELERLKVPYSIAADGQAILVNKEVVHATRMKLMGRDLPLRGAVGFELFNNSEFGMTEFAQKISYQRALQGELTRTILALAEIKDARVHLALPDEGLFKRATAKGKAAVTLHLQSGRSLRPEQIAGIQRLVSASVTGVATQDVAIVDSEGVVLSRSPIGAQPGEPEGISARLDLKRETEKILSRKATEVLDKVFGPGQALASVDVTLNMDQLRVTTEEILPSPAPAGPATGVIVREREVVREGVQSTEIRPGEPGVVKGGQSQRDTDYQVGKRMEQLTSMPGAIRRIHVVAVVRRSLDPAQTDQLRTLVSTAVGAIVERGDQVVVQSLSGLVPDVDSGQSAKPDALHPSAENATSIKLQKSLQSEAKSRGDTAILVSLTLLILTMLVLGLNWVFARKRASMTAMQREAALERIKTWLGAKKDHDALRE